MPYAPTRRRSPHCCIRTGARSAAPVACGAEPRCLTSSDRWRHRSIWTWCRCPDSIATPSCCCGERSTSSARPSAARCGSAPAGTGANVSTRAPTKSERARPEPVEGSKAHPSVPRRLSARLDPLLVEDGEDGGVLPGVLDPDVAEMQGLLAHSEAATESGRGGVVGV